MKQYCRYCYNMVVGDVNYCEAHSKCLSNETIKRINKCKDFIFNKIDAITFNKYKPKENNKDYEQITMEVKTNEN